MSAASNSTGPDFTAGSLLTLLFGFVGGYADAASYLLLQSFTGHVTVNSVLFAISLVSRNWPLAALQFWAVACFLGGTLASLLLEGKPHRLSRSISIRLSLALEAFLIAAAAHILWHHWPADHFASLTCLCFALGIQNGAVSKIQGLSVHTTFITGLTTKILSTAVKDKNPQFRILAALARRFCFGALVSAVLTGRFQSLSLLLPAVLVFSIAVLAKRGQLEIGLEGAG